MSGNSIGKIFKLTSFGESHGRAVGGVIDGCPAGIEISINRIQHELDRRRPGQSSITTSRNEEDKVEILSGLFEGKTTGMPIAFLVANNNQRSRDYAVMKDLFRPSHADYTWYAKYGVRDYRGGGRSSAREHVARVVAGAVAMQVMEPLGIKVKAYVSAIGDAAMEGNGYLDRGIWNEKENEVRCPDEAAAARMVALIQQVRSTGDSIGGIVNCVIHGVPAGLGEPVFDRFQARLAMAMMSINAAKGFEYGEGFNAARMRGSMHNDPFILKDGILRTSTNHSGGIQGGVTNGEDIFFRVAFKPVATISISQKTVDINGNETEFSAQGRHDTCVVPRAVPVVEAMAAGVVLDMLLESKTVGLQKSVCSK